MVMAHSLLQRWRPFTSGPALTFWKNASAACMRSKSPPTQTLRMDISSIPRRSSGVIPPIAYPLTWDLSIGFE